MAFADPPNDDFTALEKVIQEELTETKTPGAAIAIVRGDRIIYAKGFGVANIETGAPVTPDMLFRLGSTTKMFTGAAMVTLSTQGKIKLDAPVGNYAKSLNPKLARITAHQLISNTAGMADFEAPFSNDDEPTGLVNFVDDCSQHRRAGLHSIAPSGFHLLAHPYAASILSIPFMYGRSASGMTTEPSACW